MLVRYGQAAMIAAILALTGNTVWAQAYILPGGTIECCKDGKCCKDEGCCCKSKKCDEKCSCCKDKKCECKTGGECCCGKSGKYCGCCPVMSKLAKHAAIIMVMPSSLPMFGGLHVEAMGMLPHPPLPVGPQVVLPAPLPPLPPILTPPGVPVPTLTSPVMPPQTVALPAPPPGCYTWMTPHTPPCPPGPCMPARPALTNVNMDTCLSLLGVASELCSLVRPLSAPSLCASALGLLIDLCPVTYVQGPAPYLLHPPQYVPPSPMPADYGERLVEPCEVTTPATAAKVRIIATPSSDQLEMNVGDDTCIRCKKMTLKIGDNEITLSRFDDRVRVRGEELKATANSVRSDRKDRLILEGDVVLHYRKDGHSANVTGDRIELNLSSGAVTIKPAAKTSSSPAVHIDRVDP